MIPHLVENVRVPAAHATLVVFVFANSRGYDLKAEPFYPVLHEAFDVCRGRDPFIQQKSLDLHKKEWTTGSPGLLCRSASLIKISHPPARMSINSSEHDATSWNPISKEIQKS